MKNKKPVLEYLKENILVLDGAMGTTISERVEMEGPPELLNLKSPDIIKKIHGEFIEAGSGGIETNSFGANRIKLQKFNLGDRAAEISKRAAQIAKEAAGGKAYVFGSVGPTGALVEPVGNTSFDEIYDVFAEQASALEEGGCHAIIVETFIDIQEARIALIAALENTNLPVFVTLTFSSEFRMEVSATTPEAAVGILESIGASGVGSNCGMGPEQISSIAEKISKVRTRPIVFQPNAGIPRLVEGKTVFDATEEDFKHFSEKVIGFGAGIVGGCCGSKPEHISAISGVVGGIKPQKARRKKNFYLCTPGNYFSWNLKDEFISIGERINPAGKEDLREDISKEKFNLVEREAKKQVEEGADILDVNVSVALKEEKQVLPEAVKRIYLSADIPLSIDSTQPEAVERALKIYPGRALVNSVNAGEESLSGMLKIARRYGAAVVGLALSDKGVSKSVSRKIKALKTIVDRGLEIGFKEEDFLLDPVVLSAATSSIEETVKAIKHFSKRGLFTVAGISNVSHGLPNRRTYNRAFASIAVSAGLAAAIVDTSDRKLMEIIYASQFLTGRNREVRAKNLKQTTSTSSVSADLKKITQEDKLTAAIIEGKKEEAAKAVKKLLNKNKKAYRIVSEIMAPAMGKVGEKFEKKEIFLPHVLMAAEAMKEAFSILKPHFEGDEDSSKKPKVVLATVKGDVHDIGKNIVSTILSANGYEVVDLGVDIDADRILAGARKEGAEIVGLSCLMTTTLPSLQKTIGRLKEDLPEVLVAVGGAVVTEKVKEKYGADIYSKDAMRFVKVLENMDKERMEKQ